MLYVFVCTCAPSPKEYYKSHLYMCIHGNASGITMSCLSHPLWDELQISQLWKPPTDLSRGSTMWFQKALLRAPVCRCYSRTCSVVQTWAVEQSRGVSSLVWEAIGLKSLVTPLLWGACSVGWMETSTLAAEDPPAPAGRGLWLLWGQWEAFCRWVSSDLVPRCLSILGQDSCWCCHLTLLVLIQVREKKLHWKCISGGYKEVTNSKSFTFCLEFVYKIHVR